MSLLERFKLVTGDELGLRPGLALVEVSDDEKQDEVKLGDTGKSLIMAKPDTHKLSREEKKTLFVKVLAVSSDDEMQLSPGNMVLVSRESITTFSVYGRLRAKEESVGMIQTSSVMQVFENEDGYEATFRTLNDE